MSTTKTGSLSDFSQGPLSLKCDFKSKNYVKGIALSCDHKNLFFNLSRHIFMAEMKDVFSKGREKAEKIKIRN